MAQRASGHHVGFVIATLLLNFFWLATSSHLHAARWQQDVVDLCHTLSLRAFPLARKTTNDEGRLTSDETLNHPHDAFQRSRRRWFPTPPSSSSTQADSFEMPSPYFFLLSVCW